MDDERRQKLYELLRRGLKLVEDDQELPAEWAREIFPSERREYELTYYGKESEEKILADTMAVPLQPISTFGKGNTDWQNELIYGDNLQAMKTLLQMKERGNLVNSDGTPGVRLIYIDPPFATKREFRGSQDQKAYQDKIAGADFLEFLRKRLILLRELLSQDGSIYVHLDRKKGHYVKVLMDEIFSENNFRNELIWQSTTASKFQSNNFPKTYSDIYLYSKSENFLFNKPYTEFNQSYLDAFYKYEEEGTARTYRISDFTQTGQGPARTFGDKGKISPPKGKHWIWSQERIDDGIKKGLVLFSKKGYPGLKRYLDEREGNPVRDIWTDIKDIAPLTAERLDYPTQKPEELLARIIAASSKEGDLVLDAFAGSGTTCAVAEKLGRRWIAVDCGKLAIYTIQKRLLNLKEGIGNTGKNISPKPFTLYNAGLYDFENLQKLPWEGWRSMALQLFECKDEPHKIKGFQMDGYRQGSSVYVFNHFKEGKISRETIIDIHTNIGKQVGDRCFIIAPRGVFLFQEDYIELDGVRYYALRIPYSYISELHRREFSALRQPSDESAVNETVDAVGFDFIQPPIVEFEKKEREGIVSIKIKKFESRARVKGENKKGSFDTLSMAMIDFDYDGKVFDMDKVFYAADIEKAGRKIEFSKKDIIGNVMLVLLDIYGNEARIIVHEARVIKIQSKQKYATAKK